MRKLTIAVLALLALASFAATVVGVAVYVGLRTSLPLLEGRVVLPKLVAPVIVERDELGVPAIRGRSRIDVARVTGFLHGQERFFQMDLQRRRAAGELAEIFGAAALPLDRGARVHRFRERARRAFGGLSASDIALLEAYTDGVNAGLHALAAPPFEYRLLGIEPEPWRLEDAGLTLFAMYLVLQDATGKRESAVGVMHDVLPKPLFEFLAAPSTLWDAPIEGDPIPVAAIPGPEVFDLRTAGIARTAEAAPPSREPWESAAGSNNWVVAGSLTEHGGAMVADDMHLPLAVPNVWYRVSLEYPVGDAIRRVAGVTLPGTPAVIVGSNGSVGWGFTNSQGDWSDLVVLEADPEEPDAYRTPNGPRRFERFQETLAVRGGEAEEIEVFETIWGPVIDRDHEGRPRALRWVAHDLRALNLAVLQLEAAVSVSEALETAGRAGIPAQNLAVGDRAGHIAWTIIGPIPRRFGHDGQLPSSWADGRRGWSGWLRPDEYPRVVDPESGRIWTANNRVVSGEKLTRIGPGAFLNGARARQIRDDLRASSRFTESDMLAIQLDDRALFLTPWRELLLGVLSEAVVREDPRRAELRGHVEGWEARAAVDSVGYRIVRGFRDETHRRAFGALTAGCRDADPDFRYDHSGHQQEGPLWRLVTERPAHLLDPRYASWDALLLEAVDAVIDGATADGAGFESFTWGSFNAAQIRHPMSAFLPPWLAGFLDMPADPLAGDANMPRQQTHAYGVSQRMVVSPGRETTGIFHMPGGQSGHPLSPFYRRGHEAWVKGEATPFLPGPPRHVTRFDPAT